MLEQPIKEEILFIIKEIENDSAVTQRALSAKLGISLGKINYLLKGLIKRGLIKAKNLSSNPGKLRKIYYILTKKGLEEKARLMYRSLKRKETEYNRIKKEWNGLLMKQQIADDKLKVTMDSK